MIKSCKKPPVYFESTTGSFYSQYADLPLKSCVSQISGYQEGSGTPNPTDNIRPLHAFSSADLVANGTTYTFSFGQNIYSGYIDWLRGVVVGTHAIETFNLDDNTGGVDTLGSYKRRAYKLSNECVTNDTQVCSVAPYLNSYSAQSLHFYCLSTATYNRMYLILPDTITELNGIQVAYPLATPVTIPLGGIEINTILGLNSLSSSVGTISAEYLKAGR